MVVKGSNRGRRDRRAGGVTFTSTRYNDSGDRLDASPGPRVGGDEVTERCDDGCLALV